MNKVFWILGYLRKSSLVHFCRLIHCFLHRIIVQFDFNLLKFWQKCLIKMSVKISSNAFQNKNV